MAEDGPNALWSIVGSTIDAVTPNIDTDELNRETRWLLWAFSHEGTQWSPAYASIKPISWINHGNQFVFLKCRNSSNILLCWLETGIHQIWGYSPSINWQQSIDTEGIVTNSPESKDMKSISGPNREEIDSIEAEIYPDSECCFREKHDHESSNLDAPRRSLVKMKKNYASQCGDTKWPICQIRSDWHGEYQMAFDIVCVEATMIVTFLILILLMAQSGLRKSGWVQREKVHRTLFRQHSREPNGLVI
jgi:hypothetical protein